MTTIDVAMLLVLAFLFALLVFAERVAKLWVTTRVETAPSRGCGLSMLTLGCECAECREERAS